MNKEDLEKTLQYFEEYSDGDYYDYLEEPRKAKWYMHRGDWEYRIIVFEKDNSVYQVGTEADTVGVELKTFEDLKVRYKSFLNDDVEKIYEHEEEE